MLDEYKTPRKFWPEAIDTACHIINLIYLHKLLKKTSYELLTFKKPNVSYFRVFGARCWIKDPHHTSKFAPKAHEGFMLGYGKDSHSYRVFNLFHYKVVETVDVRFDETNGSQRDHLPNVLDELSPSESIKKMGTGEIIPSENQIEKMIDSLNAPGPLTRSRATQLANFCGLFAFVFMSEPKKVAEAIMEPEWIQAMQ